MTVDTFNWFLHVMLYLHILRVFRKQEEAELRRVGGEGVEDDNGGNGVEEDVF